MYIAMNRFKVNAGHEDEFEGTWKTRTTYLDQVPGFLKFWLLRGEEGDFISFSQWDSRDSFIAWTEGEAFKKAHESARTPKGVLAGPPVFSGYEIALEESAN